jgi:hypothetical protein
LKILCSDHKHVCHEVSSVEEPAALLLQFTHGSLELEIISYCGPGVLIFAVVECFSAVTFCGL